MINNKLEKRIQHINNSKYDFITVDFIRNELHALIDQLPELPKEML